MERRRISVGKAVAAFWRSRWLDAAKKLRFRNHRLSLRIGLDPVTTTPVLRDAWYPPVLAIGRDRVVLESIVMASRLSRYVWKRHRRRAASLRLERLEARAMLATYDVTTLADAGSGSLRAAIQAANARPGVDEIRFLKSGTIHLDTALPALISPVTLDGSTVPEFAGPPAVTIQFGGQTGLELSSGSTGSVIKNLSLVDASGAGVTISESGMTLEGNFVGVLPDGVTAMSNGGAGIVIAATSNGNQIGTGGAGNLISGNGQHGVVVYGKDNQIAANKIGISILETPLPNGGDGIRLMPGASGNLIGDDDPVESIVYFDADEVSLPVQTWTGIRGYDEGQFLLTGTSNSGGVESGLLYVGPLEGTAAGQVYTIEYPGVDVAETTVYGPDDLGNGDVLLVGTYVRKDDATRYGFSFQGNLATMERDLQNPDNFQTIWNGSPFNYLHSTMGGLAVGNYVTTDSPNATGRSFLYDMEASQFIHDIVFPGSLSNTAYGIWDNGDGRYTIAGGFSPSSVNNMNNPSQPLGEAFLVDYERLTGSFSNWRSFSFQTDAPGNPVTHFQGISSVQKGVYTLSADAVVTGEAATAGWVTVARNADGSFGDMTWTELSAATPVTNESGVTSANSVYGNTVVGVVATDGGVASFQARINLAGHSSNLISGNSDNGIAVIGSTNNVIAMNQIGTDSAGIKAVPNGGNGILLADGASGNLIGGTATAGNDPTGNVFRRPPQGNLISGNTANGVLLTSGATGNTLSGNFIGTTASGTGPLGNAEDGVAIVAADGNALLGTTLQQNPFVFYNVLSGNGGHGLRITNSNNTTVQANFAGIGADNKTVVPNGGNGIFVDGTSASILAGGPIPMGNVTSGNSRHGIELADQTSGFVSFNNFVGMVAFGGAAPNSRDGIHVTATGGDNLIRTCLVAGNLGNGILIGGSATGVTIEDTATGTNSGINAAIPNGGSGVVITDDAYGNAIGGFQPSVETKVHLSGNDRYGLEITGTAHDNVVFNTVIGAGFRASEPIANALGGVFIGAGTSGTVFGGSEPLMANRVLFNAGNGVTVVSASNTELVGNEIRDNTGYGLKATGACPDSRVVQNLIVRNDEGNVDIHTATGMIYIPGFLGPASETVADVVKVVITRPLLQRVVSVQVVSDGMGPWPVMLSPETIAQAAGLPTGKTSLIVSRVITGRVEKWDGSAWVDVSTSPRSSSPVELLRKLKRRLIEPDDWMRWTPGVEESSSNRALAFSEWDGSRLGESTDVLITS